MKNSKILVTGGAGFIGSHLVDKLIKESEVIVLDNLSTGKEDNIKQHFNNPNFQFHKVDLVKEKICTYFKDVDVVWHLAANPDVKAALKNTRVDIDQNILATYRVLEAMRKSNVKKIIFTSSSAVYGEANKIPTPEDYGPLMPISLYGASKLSCEVLISAYCHTFDMDAVILRLANIIGPRSAHGVIFDFIVKLKENPNELEILGNGNQKKSYLYIYDCIDAMLIAAERAKNQVEIFNVGSEEWVTVKEIAKIVCEELKLNPKFRFTGGKRGWKGDVPAMLLDITRIKKFRWKPQWKLSDALRETIRWYI